MNSRHPGPRRMWEVGSEPQFLTPLPSFPSLRPLRSRIPKTQILSLYACVRRSRASGIGHGIKKLDACVGVCEGHDAPVQASTYRTTFDGKTNMFWITFFPGLAKGPPVDAQA